MKRPEGVVYSLELGSYVTANGVRVDLRNVGGAYVVAFDAWGRRRTCHNCGRALYLPHVGRPPVDCHMPVCVVASNRIRRKPLWRGEAVAA